MAFLGYPLEQGEKAILRLLLVIAFAIFFPAAAHAQSVLQNLASGGSTVALADDAGGTSSSAPDLVAYLSSSSDAGHLSQPFGSGSTSLDQDCTGSAALDSSVAGTAAPYIQTNSDMTGTQDGFIPSTVLCVSSSAGSFIFDFGFFSPTFSSILGGDSLPVAFRLDGALDASAVCTSGFLCAYTSSAVIQVTERPGPVTAFVNVNNTGRTSG